MSALLAIDIGSSKITAIIAERSDSSLKFLGSGMTKSRGLKKGSIVNIEEGSKAIKEAVSDAYQQAGVRPKKAVVAVPGAYARSVNSHGIANIPTKEITVKDIARAIETARYNASVPNEYEVLHVLPYGFRVDEQENIQDAAGMSGSRLEVSVHIVIAQKSALENLRRTVLQAGVEIENFVLSGYAAAIAVLSEDEKDLGVCVIDIGGSTSNLVIHSGNTIRHNAFLPVGGSHISADLSMALHTPPNSAEKIKIEYGSLISDSMAELEIPKIGEESATQRIKLDYVNTVITMRIEEMLTILHSLLEKSGFKQVLGAGVVITGGVAKLDGLSSLAGSLFGNLPVRIARPKNIENLLESLKDYSFSVALGLIRYAAGEYTLYEIDSNKKLKTHYKEPSHEPETRIADQLEDILPKENEKKIEKKESFDDIMIIEPQSDGFMKKIRDIWLKLTKIF